MAIGDFRKSFKPPGATLEELNKAPPPEARELIIVEGTWEIRVGDGQTVGGVPQGGGGTGGTGDAIAFRTIAVEGVAPELWLQADQVNDVLTITPLRGFVVAPIAGTDTLGVGLPDGGTFGNVLKWTVNSWVPNPPDPAVYVPQPGEIPVDYLLEGERKVWDGYVPLLTFLPAANPASTVSHNGAEFPSLGATATNLLRSYCRVPLNSYEDLAVVIRCQNTATTGDARMVARLAVVTDITAAPTFENDALLTVTMPGTAGPFDIEIVLDDIGATQPGSQVLLEFGRLGADAADTSAGSLIVADAFLRLR